MYGAKDQFRRNLDAGRPTTRDGCLRVSGFLAVSSGVVAVLVALTVLLFPTTIIEDDQFTNVFAHVLGFGYGFVVFGGGYRHWRTSVP